VQVFNPTDTPQVVDDKGHVIEGGETGTVTATDRVKRLVESGVLREIDPKAEHPAGRSRAKES